MAQIRTINGERHKVIQTKEEIDRIFHTQECIDVGLVYLDLHIIRDTWEPGPAEEFKPVSFIRNNIIMYY